MKAKLTHQIAVAIKSRGLSQNEAAALIGLPQPKLSNMLCGQFRGISEDKVIRCLAALGHDVTIVVSRRQKGRGRVAVTSA